ncbi:recombinational DNA repair protein (RecE pathway) [Paenibacillus odorifer]|uniref:Recombinational DNA repair protein (RecE pathway) n=1 Tax=Paenibacillus odorifer TaxID=189426 RepID=A0ABX3GIE4_9BACL|nr:recombinase RecT [Paenibacillus odorifer]OMC76501.1 recombinational DNA repair protein (RecE pathway) [Paenibacillus odorifer]OMD18588.1 recombinational DNA repair protein (RecE pathway) [Paenibacillus odorifer]
MSTTDQTKQQTAPAEIAKKEPTQSERFMTKVISEFGSGVGEVALTKFQKRLAQNYFIALDAILKTTEEKRLKKSEKFRDAVPVTWQHVNMEKLARDVVAMARVGFDPSQPNHINPIPYKNKHSGKYDITFIEGYRGIELKATKYGLDVPDHVTVELVYSTDKFRPIKKDSKNQYEGYEFEIVNAFDRGNIIGGFYYHSFSKVPEKNKLVVMTKKDIEKRKPDHASAEFWGGEKDKWENNKKVGTETVEGWYDKMAWKTIYRAAYGDITIDSQKIDDDYLRLKQMESDFAEAEVDEEIRANANGSIIDITPTDPPGNKPDSQPEESKDSAKPDDFSGDVPSMEQELDF